MSFRFNSKTRRIRFIFCSGFC